MNRDRMRELDAEIRALYAKRRPLTSSLRFHADPVKSEELRYIDEQIDVRELEYERLGKKMSARMRPKETRTMKRCAVVWTTGWAGDIAYRVFVVGETPTKYIVTPAVSRFRRPGGEKWLEMGETMRPPKYAVAFFPKWKGAPRHATGRLPSNVTMAARS